MRRALRLGLGVVGSVKYVCERKTGDSYTSSEEPLPAIGGPSGTPFQRVWLAGQHVVFPLVGFSMFIQKGQNEMELAANLAPSG